MNRIIWIFLTSLLFFISLPLGAQQIDMDQVYAEENLRWGVRAFHYGYYNNAIQFFEKTLSLKPGNELARFWLGKTFLKSGFEEAALNEWNVLLNREEKDPLLEYRVQVLTMRRGISGGAEEEPRLVLLKTLNPGGENFYSFKKPTSVRKTAKGGFFVVAYGSNEVVLIDAAGAVSRVMKGGIAGYDHPFDILENTDGTFFLSEYEGDRILHCSSDGDVLKTIGSKGIGKEQFLGPQYMAADSKGFFYVSDWGNSRVVKLSREGEFVLNFGQKGPVEGRLLGPTGLAVLGDHIYVADKIRKRIALYDLNGNYTGAIGEGILKGPEGIFQMEPSVFLIADSEENESRLLRLEVANEKFSSPFDFSDKAVKIVNSTVDSNGNYITLDYETGKVFILSSMEDLYSGYNIEIERIQGDSFPNVVVDFSLVTRAGRPVVGLTRNHLKIKEEGYQVNEFSLFGAVADQEALDLVILIEKSPELLKYKKEIKEAVNNLYFALGDKCDIKILSAGETAVTEIEKYRGRPDTLDEISKGSSRWVFDQGLRLGGTALLSNRNKRAIVYLSAGSPGLKPYSNYNLMELVNFFKNNHISFNTLYFGTETIHEDLDFLCGQTGGTSLSFYHPRGTAPLSEHLAALEDSRYTLSFESFNDPGFGKKYITVSIEVMFNSITGRDELGYFSLLE